MFTEHVGNLQAAKSLEELKQVLEQVLGDCEAALTHDGSLRINGALPPGATGGVLHVSNGHIAPADGDTAPDANGELPNGWAHIVGPGGAWFQEQVRFDKVPVGDGISALAALPAGSVIMWAGDIGSIPSDWAIMDGTANSIGNGGSGIDMRGYLPMQYVSGDPDFGTIGGTITPSLDWSGSPLAGDNTTVTTSSDGAHTHTTTGAQIATTIDVTMPNLEHFATSGGTTVTTQKDVWAVDDSPSIAVFDGTTAPDSNYLSGDGDEVTDVGHDHNILKSEIIAAIDDHEPQGCSVAGILGNSATSSSNGAHTHTVTINNTLAGKLSVNTPNQVRPAGKVVAYIEKLAV